jgi:hypothetical protein
MLAKLLEQLVIVRSKEAVKVGAHLIPRSNPETFAPFPNGWRAFSVGELRLFFALENF